MILAIDPGNEQSAFMLLDGCGNPSDWGIKPNFQMLHSVRSRMDFSELVVERIQSYGKTVGKEIF